MEKTILLISKAETFSVRGLEMKLKDLGADTRYSGMSIKTLEKECPEAALFMLYMDETISEAAECLVYLKDFCCEHKKQIIVIGTKNEYEEAQKLLTGETVRAFFERPLEMDRLLDETELFFEEEKALLHKKSILIVDDDVPYMYMINDWLKSSYRTTMVNSGMQAITWIAKNHADLILLDYEMPVTSGPQVLKMIRSELQTADIPVMFLTAKNDKASIMNVLELKPEDYILKTIDRKGLLEKLEDFFYGGDG